MGGQKDKKFGELFFGAKPETPGRALAWQASSLVSCVASAVLVVVLLWPTQSWTYMALVSSMALAGYAAAAAAFAAARDASGRVASGIRAALVTFWLAAFVFLLPAVPRGGIRFVVYLLVAFAVGSAGKAANKLTAMLFPVRPEEPVS